MTPEEIQQLIEAAIKAHLKIWIDTSAHVITKESQVEVTLKWNDDEIDADRVTIP